MLLALLAMDLVWALGLLGVAFAAALAALRVHAFVAASALDPGVGAALGLVLGFAAFVAVYVALVCGVLALLPNPRPGKHRLLRGRDFYLWSIGFVVRRWLDVAPIGTLVRQSSIAKLVYLRAAGAKVHPVANLSSDVVLLDPCMLTLGEGALLGSGVVVTGHFVVDGMLVLAPVVIERGVEAGADVRIAPGTRIGEGAQVQTGVVVAPFADIGAGAVIGMRAVIGSRVTIGARARIAPSACVPNGTVVPEGGTYPPSA